MKSNERILPRSTSPRNFEVKDAPKTVREMEDKLYAMMEELGGMEIPMNQPAGHAQTAAIDELEGRAIASQADHAEQIMDLLAGENGRQGIV